MHKNVNGLKNDDLFGRTMIKTPSKIQQLIFNTQLSSSINNVHWLPKIF